jgi:hypothetical protein
VTVSTSAGSASRGGATGKRAKKKNPIPAETSMALRSSRYWSLRRRKRRIATVMITGQWPQM